MCLVCRPNSDEARALLNVMMRKFWAWIDHQSQHGKVNIEINRLFGHRSRSHRRPSQPHHHYQASTYTQKSMNFVGEREMLSWLMNLCVISEISIEKNLSAWENVLLQHSPAAAVSMESRWYHEKFLTKPSNPLTHSPRRDDKITSSDGMENKFNKNFVMRSRFSFFPQKFILFISRSHIRFIFLCKWLFNFSNNFSISSSPSKPSACGMRYCVNIHIKFHQFSCEMPTLRILSSCYREERGDGWIWWIEQENCTINYTLYSTRIEW